MPIDPEPKRKGLTAKQAAAAEIITERVSSGEPFTKALIADAHDVAYGLNGDRKKAQTYAGKNLSSPAFLASLSLDNSESQKELKLWLWQCLHGTHPVFPRDKDLMIVSAKLLSRGMFVEKHHVQFEEGQFDDKSIEDLDFYATRARWPDMEEKQYFDIHQAWPDIAEAGKPN
jgi:hypothetical protein